MKPRFTRSARSVLRIALAGGACLGTSTGSLACVPEPYLAAVCIMAVPWTNLDGYAPANGGTLPISANNALYALIGVTYGGDGRTNFKLPDLQGRVVVGAGAGAGQPVYAVGSKGGNVAVLLTSNNVPQHVHILDNTGTVTMALNTLAAATTLTGLSATTTLAGVTATASASGLSLKGSSATAGQGSASGNALATTSGPPNKIYANSAPDVTMAAGSISGSAPVSFTGNPTTTITGNPSTTLSGVPSATLGGFTGPVSSATGNQPVVTMPPFLAMNYFVAITGLFPQRN